MAKTYNPKKVAFIFAGIQAVGFVDGTMIVATRNEDAVTTVVGADGEATRVMNANRSGTVTVTLHQSSPTNDQFSDKATEDELFGTGSGDLLIKDISGRTLVSSTEAWIKKVADAEFAKELGERVWTFETGDLQIFNGGN